MAILPMHPTSPLGRRRIATVVLRSFTWLGFRMVTVASWVDWELAVDPVWQVVTLRRRKAKHPKVWAVPLSQVKSIEFDAGLMAPAGPGPSEI